MPSPHVIYFHGFTSGPKTTVKGVYLKEVLAPQYASFTLPDLQGPDFFNMTLTGMLERAREAIASLPEDGRPVVLMGSSLGGWVAATLAVEGYKRLQGLLLIAPAFGFIERWQELLGPDGEREWRETGKRTFYHHRDGCDRDLGVAFLESAQGLASTPAPTTVPTWLIHGRNDETVNYRHVWPWVEASPNCQFMLLDGEHALDGNDTLDRLVTCANDVMSPKD